jgi:hypothetical protein
VLGGLRAIWRRRLVFVKLELSQDGKCRMTKSRAFICRRSPPWPLPLVGCLHRNISMACCYSALKLCAAGDSNLHVTAVNHSALGIPTQQVPFPQPGTRPPPHACMLFALSYPRAALRIPFAPLPPRIAAPEYPLRAVVAGARGSFPMRAVYIRR